MVKITDRKNLKSSDIVSAMCDNNRLSEYENQIALETLFNLFHEKILSGKPFKINGIGTFELKNIPSREGRNPHTKECIVIPPKRKVTFKQDNKLKDYIEVNRRK